MSEALPTIAVIGGTGALGSGLALRWAKAGLAVAIGSRSSERAAAKAAEINAGRPAQPVRGLENAAAAAAAEVVVLAIPFADHATILDAIRDAVQGKVVIDATVPLVPPAVSKVRLPPPGSAAQAAQQRLGDGVRVVSALHSVAAAKLADPAAAIDCDVLVCGNDAAARETAVDLIGRLGLKAWHAGPIENSAAAEALTSVLIFINRRYKIDGAGLRITGTPKPADGAKAAAGR